ncbi:MAG: hypothetical protein HYV36_06290, partial [Lentisphaerae bacterium]|nr:hypothetical protein [Lentisphaerota bacterium]
MLLAVLLGGSFAAAGLPAIALSEVERAAAGWAKEIVSNGRGGGPWTAPDAWRGNAVPGPADAVIIQTNDTIIFDGNYPDQATCRQLRIDSGARLNFKEEAAQHILSVAGPIEVRGKIHIDLSRFPRGLAEIRMVAESEAERIIHVFSNGAFMAIGASGLADGRYNVIVSTGPP